MRHKKEIDSAAVQAGISLSELEIWRSKYKEYRSIVALLKEMELNYNEDWQRIRFCLIFGFDFTPKHLSAINAWRRRECEEQNDEWLIEQLNEKLLSVHYLYE